MLSAVIIDDTPANIRTLTQLIAGYCPQVTVAGHAGNIEEAYKAICSLQPDVVFLDIEMPGGGGFELLQRFSVISFEVIFVTAYNHYAVQAFRENVLSYILKPVVIEDLQKAVARAEKQVVQKQAQGQLLQYLQLLQAQHTAGTRVVLPVQEGYMFIDNADIIRCEGAGSYSWVYLKDGRKMMISLRLKECEDLLSSAQFFRVHNSHIVNVNYISRYVKGRGGYLVLQDKTTVEVAVSRKEDFLRQIRVQK